jgi:hypothetical protein
MPRYRLTRNVFFQNPGGSLDGLRQKGEIVQWDGEPYEWLEPVDKAIRENGFDQYEKGTWLRRGVFRQD